MTNPMRLATDGKRLPRKINFSARTLAAVNCPAGRTERYVYDTKIPGLAFRAMPSGACAFYLVKWFNGGKKRVRIGGRELTVEQARQIASTLQGQVAQGIDPAEQRRLDRAVSVTLGNLIDRWIEHAKQHKKSWQGDVDQAERYLTDWRPRKLATIKQDDVRALHAKIGRDHGHYAANRLLALLHSIFGKAGDLWDGKNPAAGIQRFREKKRDRFLQADELPRFFDALAVEPNETIRDYILTALLTGQRRANVMAMRWDEIDFNRTVWRIPETKNGDPLTVPLAPAALELLVRRKASAKSEWVFPGRIDGHLQDAKAAWKSILARAGIQNLRLHDLRRSLGSWMAITGASLPIVGKALGHKNQATTAIYARLSLDPVRASVDAAADAMLKAGSKAAQ